MSNYTAWRATYQSSEQAARAAFQQLERAASPITEDMARAEFHQWLFQNRASLGRLGDTMAALMERAAIEVATRFQFVTATLEQTEPQPVATINKNNCLSIDDANRLMRLGPGTKLYVQPPSGKWVRCSEQMPELGQRVKLFSQGVVQNFMPVLGEDDEGAFWDFDDVTDYNPPVDLKRDQWMPVPQPPQEREGA